MTNAAVVLPRYAESIYTDGILDPNRRPRQVLDNLKASGGAATNTTQDIQSPFNLAEQ